MSDAPKPRHLMIPFAGRSSPACREALAGLRLPNTEAMLARLALVHGDQQDDSTRSPPHERALAEALGIGAADGCIPWAALEAKQAGLGPTGPGDSWGVATLCHWQVGIDDVVLGDPAAIEIDAAESAALLAAARPFFEEDGMALHASATPGRWLVQGKVFDGLATASIDRAVGWPISQWSPLSDAARPLRRLQNEMQMLLYTERVNDQRTARGVPPINSFWLSGTGSLPASLANGTAPASAPEVADALRVPALRDDGAGWAAAWQALDAGAMADLLADYTRGADVVLTLCGDRGARRFGVQHRGLLSWARSLFERPSAASILAAL
ncbi:hypothetical protein SRS16CHR_04226 [Variovorax sp. SRS16]|uniref:hypothetical protein n=1 Tax=Variovorax sp. SRS16 TaxID=282217 RepID=UPI0013162AE3|nr:hypothetical protein [Variovorax sp. SRS16]VTU28235.1 hypothetical protein SRS16CHR_04226 [Variovorax sp. SRS16]